MDKKNIIINETKRKGTTNNCRENNERKISKMNRLILVVMSYLIMGQTHGATKKRKEDPETCLISWERFDKEGWALDCDMGEVRGKMDLSEFYPEEEMKVVEGKNLWVHKTKNISIGDGFKLEDKSPLDTAIIVQILLREGLVYVEAIAGRAGRGRLLVLHKDEVYLIRCVGIKGKKVNQTKEETKKCHAEELIQYGGKRRYVNKVTRMVQDDSEEVECNSSQSLFQSLKQNINDKNLIEISNKEVTFSLWKDKKFSRDIAKLLNKESAMNLIRKEESMANGDSTGRMIITQIQLFLRMNAAKIAITWGVLEVVAILVIVTAGRTFAVAWWKIAVILSSIAKICYETRKSCLQVKLDDKAEELRKLQWDKMQISGNDETGSKKETHREHVHRHFDDIYDYIDEMVVKLKEYERINLVEIYRNKIDMQAVIMNNEILEGVRKTMRKIEKRNQGIVNGTEKKERGEDDEK